MANIIRKTHKIDATGKAPGRLACEIALLLKGKNKPSFLPNVDAGDFVIVSNAKFMKFTGKKFEQKEYYHYSGYPGGLKTKKAKDIFAQNPGEILKRAVFNMLPKNKNRKAMIKRLMIK